MNLSRRVAIHCNDASLFVQFGNVHDRPALPIGIARPGILPTLRCEIEQPGSAGSIHDHVRMRSLRTIGWLGSWLAEQVIRLARFHVVRSFERKTPNPAHTSSISQ